MVFTAALMTTAAAGDVAGANAASVRRDDPSLDALFAELKTARSAQQADEIEDRIWAIWSRSGDVSVDSIFRAGLIAIRYAEYEKALVLFDEVTERAPNFAEGWNKRASVEYQLGDFDAALRDVERTLAIERRHFGAMSGRALIYLAVGDDKDALRMFERALSINPASSALRQQVRMMRDKLGVRSV